MTRINSELIQETRYSGFFFVFVHCNIMPWLKPYAHIKKNGIFKSTHCYTMVIFFYSMNTTRHQLLYNLPIDPFLLVKSALFSVSRQKLCNIIKKQIQASECCKRKVNDAIFCLFVCLCMLYIAGKFAKKKKYNVHFLNIKSKLH